MTPLAVITSNSVLLVGTSTNTHPPVGKRRSLLTLCTIEMLGMFLAFNFHHNLEAGTPLLPVLPLMTLSLRCENLCGVLVVGAQQSFWCSCAPHGKGVCGEGVLTPSTLPHSPSSIQTLSCLWSSSRGPHPQKNPLPTSLHCSALGTLPDPENFLILQPRHRVAQALGASHGPESTSLADWGLWAP